MTPDPRPDDQTLPLDTSRRRSVRRFGLACMGLAAAGLGAWVWQGKQLSPAAQALWQARFQQLDGGTLALQSYRGRPLLVNFWATWCPPCVKELPELVHFQHEHPSWQVVAIAVDQAEAVRRFVQDHPLSLPLGLAGLTGLELGRTLGNSQGGLPFSVALDPQGELVWRKSGATNAAELRALAQQLA